MPKQTFFHLPKEKQDRIVEAARVEFSRRPLTDASIANIVKLAGIARGSFYQYFENKENLYYYYFDLLRRDTKKHLEACIVQADGDLIKGFDVYFSKMIFEVLTGENAAFYKNLFMNMDYRSTNRVTPHFVIGGEKKKECKREKHSQRLAAYVDFSKLKVADEQEFKLFMQMLMHVVFSSIAEGYRQLGKDPEYDIKQIIKHFKSKLDWLRNGAYH